MSELPSRTRGSRHYVGRVADVVTLHDPLIPVERSDDDEKRLSKKALIKLGTTPSQEYVTNGPLLGTNPSVEYPVNTAETGKRK